jgi:hypothetical protein
MSARNAVRKVQTKRKKMLHGLRNGPVSLILSDKRYSLRSPRFARKCGVEWIAKPRVALSESGNPGLISATPLALSKGRAMPSPKWGVMRPNKISRWKNCSAVFGFS